MADGHEITQVISGPDRRRARKAEPSPTAVKARALELGLPVGEKVADVLGTGAELGVVVAFGKLVRPEVLDELPMVNLHFSLLPRWRGAAPVERAILAGDAETGVCLMALEAGLDTGPVYGRVTVDIDENETADELRERLGVLGTELLLEHLAQGPAGLGEPVPQEGDATYASKLTPEELVLDWSRPAVELARVVRVGRASTTFRGKRLLVHRARPVQNGQGAPGTLQGADVATGDGGLELLEVQAEGRGRQPFSAWAAGARLAEGERLGV
ncbi:MAG: fmt [Acidimicrobiaceae bacterium]|nr:fmt [Acidimicrobiaceae bacterium]